MSICAVFGLGNSIKSLKGSGYIKLRRFPNNNKDILNKCFALCSFVLICYFNLLNPSNMLIYYIQKNIYENKVILSHNLNFAMSLNSLQDLNDGIES